MFSFNQRAVLLRFARISTVRLLFELVSVQIYNSFIGSCGCSVLSIDFVRLLSELADLSVRPFIFVSLHQLSRSFFSLQQTALKQKNPYESTTQS